VGQGFGGVQQLHNSHDAHPSGLVGIQQRLKKQAMTKEIWQMRKVRWLFSAHASQQRTILLRQFGWWLPLTFSLAVGCAPLSAPVHSPQQVRTPRQSLFSYPWTWTDELGQAAPFSRWRGQTIVVTAIFTQCKSTCPRTVTKLRQVEARFHKEGQGAQFLVVTLDPENDTPDVLLRFKASADLPAEWHLLSGSPGETRQLRDTLGIHVIEDGPHLLHDGRIVVFDPQGFPTRSFGGWSLADEEPM
jgi:cytochrome oxidase Cu insertion factor (SCO1/SenC/PrrC family)